MNEINKNTFKLECEQPNSEGIKAIVEVEIHNNHGRHISKKVENLIAIDHELTCDMICLKLEKIGFSRGINDNTKEVELKEQPKKKNTSFVEKKEEGKLVVLERNPQKLHL